MIILGKKTFGRLETLQYAAKRFGWDSWSDKYIIGISPYYAFWALIWGRMTGRKVIYYAIDYYTYKVKQGFLDGLFIWLFMQLDAFLCKYCDVVWDISDRINKGRKEYKKPKVSSTLVPLSYPPSYFRFNSGFKNIVVFVGLVPYGVTLLENQDYVWLKGLPIVDLLYELSRCGIGVSLWQKDGNNFYGDPGKTKLYSACGLPVIMTSNSPYAEVIRETRAGLVVPYDKTAVSNAIKIIQADYFWYKKNVKKTWEYINADDIFGNIPVLGRKSLFGR
jgi:glycosyltransferase involved in cell wall biosynthesis